MTARPRVVLLTGDERRHRFVANQYAAAFDLAGVLYETKRPIVPPPEAACQEDIAVIQQHLDERDAVEKRLLGNQQHPAQIAQLAVPAGKSNTSEVFHWVAERKPEYLLVYGTGLIKPPLLTAFTGRIVNIHLGLSPYYRGSGTNFWPLVDRRPECVGATIHIIDADVDSGPILHQVRPEASATDRAHELGTKTIMAAACAMPQVLAMFRIGAVVPAIQDLTVGRVFRRADFNADAVRTMWRQFDEGMMPEYLADQANRSAAYPIKTCL